MLILQKVDLKDIYSLEKEDFNSGEGQVGLEIQLNAEDLAYLRSEPEFFAIKNMILEKKNLIPYIVHAPFKDLSISSDDSFIREYSIRNLLGSIDFCYQIGVRKLVFHTGFPYCLLSTKKETFYQKLKKSVETLAVFAEKKKITLIVENTYEKDMTFFKKLFEDFPKIMFALDIGHSYCFSKQEAFTWIEALGHKMIHCHVHDNDLEEDLHLSLGKGKIPLPEIFQKLPELESVTLETPLKELKENVHYLKTIIRK